jgi:hypothetical protein
MLTTSSDLTHRDAVAAAGAAAVAELAAWIVVDATGEPPWAVLAGDTPAWAQRVGVLADWWRVPWWWFTAARAPRAGQGGRCRSAVRCR